MPSTTSASLGRFELPILEPLDSLTAGTDIPPPPESPIEEKPPEPLPNPESKNVSAVAEGMPINGHSNSGDVSNGYIGRGRTNESTAPTSPISQTGLSSIRKFLSRKSLNINYTNGTNSNNSQENLNLGGARPESPGGFSTATGMKRRSMSWFRRFTSGGFGEPEAKRTSVVYEETNVPTGPPPPTLPELYQLKAKVEADDAGSLGGDEMFKNIN